MRIAFFVHQFPSVSETFIMNQVTGLLRLGHQVHVYAERQPEADTPLYPEWDSYNLEARTTYLNAEMPPESGYWCMPVWPISGEIWLPGANRPIQNIARFLNALPTLQSCWEKAPELTRQLLDVEQYGSRAASLESLYHLSSLIRRQGQFDVLHAHFGPIGNHFRFARTLWNAPFVVTFHGHDFSAAPLVGGRHLYQRLFEESDLIMPVSSYARLKLEELGCPDSKLHVLHTGVKLSSFDFQVRRRDENVPVRILTIGRLVEKKGIEYALHAVALCRQHFQIRYEIIGEGPLRPMLELVIQELELSDIVIMHGAADQQFVKQRIDHAHLFLLPSITGGDGDQEGIPVSLMEAQACGLPVLSTRHSGIPELVLDGRSGFLVPERDATALANRLIFMVEHSQQWPEMGKQGRLQVEKHYDIEKLNDQLVQVYQHAIGMFRSDDARSLS